MGQTVHVLPIDDLVEHADEGTDCVCGPRVERVPSEDGDGWLVVHHSLDGREHNESDHDRSECPTCCSEEG